MRNDLLLRPNTNHRPRPTHLGHHTRQILTPHRLSHIPQIQRRRAGRRVPFLAAASEIVQREFLVVGGSVDLGGGEEAGAVDRAVVEGGEDGVVFVRDGGGG